MSHGIRKIRNRISVENKVTGAAQARDTVVGVEEATDLRETAQMTDEPTTTPPGIASLIMLLLNIVSGACYIASAQAYSENFEKLQPLCNAKKWQKLGMITLILNGSCACCYLIQRTLYGNINEEIINKEIYNNNGYATGNNDLFRMNLLL
uniref:Uncharacterized protein n=1 Tax=Glossina austeni TaxID=7395 RepID=A0A1A9VPF7_GLOAU